MSPSPCAQSAQPKMLVYDSGAMCIEFGGVVLGKLDTLVRRGMSALPKRGLEVGGILLGTAPPRNSSLVRVDDIRPIMIEHQYGPSFRLSGQDRQAFTDVIREARESGLFPMGHFRSHTRGELQLTEDDLVLANSFRGDAFRWMLLIRAAAFEPCKACLYMRDRSNRWAALASFLLIESAHQQSVPPSQTIDGYKTARSAVESPAPILTLNRLPSSPQGEQWRQVAPARAATNTQEQALLPAVLTGLERSVAIVANAMQIRGPRPSSAREEPAHSLAAVQRPGPAGPPAERRGLERAVAAVAPPLHFALAIAACVLILLSAAVVFKRTPNPQPAALPALGPSLGLRVRILPGALAIDWDRELAVVRNSAGAILVIRDGPDLRRILLTPLEARSGSFVYKPSTQDVSLRLEIAAGGGSPLTEAIRVLDASVPPAVAGLPKDASAEADGSEPAPSPAKGRTGTYARRRR